MARILKIETMVTRAFARALQNVLECENGIAYRDSRTFYDEMTMSCVRMFGHCAIKRARAELYSPLLGNWCIELVSGPHGRLDRTANVADISLECVNQLYGAVYLNGQSLGNSVPFDAVCVERTGEVALYRKDDMSFLVMLSDDCLNYRILSGQWKYARVLYDAACQMSYADRTMYVMNPSTFSDGNIVFALVLDIKDSFRDQM